MSNSDQTPLEKRDFGQQIALIGAFILVVIGLFNSMPTIPGLKDLIHSVAGNNMIVIRKFPYEYLYPLVFVFMMTIVALRHSFWRAYILKSPLKSKLGLGMDIALVVMSVVISITYLIEIDSVCLIDQFTGERAELMIRALQEEIEFAKLYGLPAPTTIDDPTCINTMGIWIIPIVAIFILVFLGFNVKVWGLPLVMVAIVIASYLLLSVMVWYFWGAEDINKYLITKLGGEPRQLLDGRPNVHDVLVNNSQGLLGRFMGILLNSVFPYIVLGTLFGVSAGGKSMIKLAFLLTRNLRGGPAHAAIVSSALFGTISGGPVINVLSTGVLTIPMMLKRGFSKVFAGGIEASASSGGQIMPPVMGVAAFVLSAMTVVPYRQIIVAASLPALAFFGCLFLSVVFQARKQGIKAVGEITEDGRLTRRDWLNLLMIVAPILLILVLLLTPKEAVGCGFIASVFGVEQIFTNGNCRVESLPWIFKTFQNAAGDAGSAGWWAMALLAVLFFLDPEIRKQPKRLVMAFAEAGILISTLYLMFLAVSVIDFSLNMTGLSSFIAGDIVHLLRDLGGVISENGFFLFLALFVTMFMAVLLGMGMPSVPAYLNVALLMGPMLIGLGIATFTAHMFIFYFAVASAITPPVAVAAFAAASITKADPMATGFSAVKSGIVMFVIPFIFAFYPELLLIPAAQLDPTSSTGAFLEGYDGKVHLLNLVWLCGRVGMTFYLISSALSAYDNARLDKREIIIRLALAAMVISSFVYIYIAGLILTAILLFYHFRTSNKGDANTTATA